ncbi:MAG TPA: DNA polymerase IV [Thermoanaerobaculia bacterium]|nr:DNA polymerase IV [Thermoanaerobaculia bacterium]
MPNDSRRGGLESVGAERPRSASARRILHCDMDCFFAAVHVRDEPQLAGQPVVVGGSPEGRGVVAAASYEARRYGIHSAMPAARARRLCPQAVFLRPDFSRYRQESELLFALFREYTPLVQPASLDEAYLDVTEHLAAWESATAIARDIRRRVREERRLTVSVGVGPNRLVAKIASDFHKPDGLTVVPPRRVAEFLAALPVRRLHGVGPATEGVLAELGAATIGQLRRLDRDALTRRFGRHGATLHAFAQGVDDRPVRAERERKSLGTETTYDRDLRDLPEIHEEVDRLADEVAAGLARRDLLGRTLTVKVRYPDFTTVTRSRTVEQPFTSAAELRRCARVLLALTEAGRRPVRLLGVTAANLLEARFSQLPLFAED